MENQIPQQSTPQQPPEIPIVIKKGKSVNWLLISSLAIFTIVTLLLIGTLGYLLSSNKNTPKVVTQIPPTITATPTPTPDPTANWKTYNNSTLGYSIKYPINIQPALQQDSRVYQGIGGLVNIDEWALLGQPSYSIQVVSYKIGVNSKLEFNLQPQPTTTVQIANETVNKIDSVDGTLIQVGPIQNSGNEYIIIYNSGTQKNIEGLSLFDQILSTFKFTQ